VCRPRQWRLQLRRGRIDSHQLDRRLSRLEASGEDLRARPRHALRNGKSLCLCLRLFSTLLDDHIVNQVNAGVLTHDKGRVEDVAPSRWRQRHRGGEGMPILS